MCGIAGFCNLRKDYVLQRRQWIPVLRRMNIVQKHRGPDDDGIYLKRNCGMAHVRLSIIDLRTGHQPMVRRHGTRECCIIFNGEIYNMRQLKSELMQEGEKFETTSDTEVILVGLSLIHIYRVFVNLYDIFFWLFFADDDGTSASINWQNNLLYDYTNNGSHY